MKKSLLILVIGLVGYAGLTSFVGVANGGDTPGVIEFIGDAGSPTKLYFKPKSQINSVIEGTKEMIL